jgi:hypothetical protein
MKINTTTATKSDLLDYVTKFEFNEFRTEMLDRFDGVSDKFVSIDARFNAVDKRFDSLEKRFDGLDRKFEQLREEFRVHTGVLLQEFRAQSKIAMEYMKHIGENKADKKDFEVLEMKVDRLIEG